MSDDIMVCKGCDEEYDTEDHVPYITPFCFHNICKQCMEHMERNVPMQCPNCDAYFTPIESRPNFIAYVLLQQAENDRNLIHELIGSLDELKFNPVKPKRDVTPTPPTSPIEVGPSSVGHPLAPSYSGTARPPLPSHQDLAAPRTFQGYIPSLGSPPRNRRTVPQNAGGVAPNTGPSDLPPAYSDVMPNSPYMGKSKYNGNRNMNSINRVVTVENLNPDWTIPDINERFGQLGVIFDRFPQRDANGKIKQIDLHYEDAEIANNVVFVMNGTPNDCGGKLNVHLKVFGKKKSTRKSRPFDPERTVCIGNWGPHITEDDLKEIFSKYGRILACRRNLDQHGKLTGTALLEFEAPQCAKMAIAAMNMQLIPGRNFKLTVEEFVPRHPG